MSGDSCISYLSCCWSDSLCSTCSSEWWWRTFTSAARVRRKKKRPGELPKGLKRWTKNAEVWRTPTTDLVCIDITESAGFRLVPLAICLSFNHTLSCQGLIASFSTPSFIGLNSFSTTDMAEYFKIECFFFVI